MDLGSDRLGLALLTSTPLTASIVASAISPIGILATATITRSAGRFAFPAHTSSGTLSLGNGQGYGSFGEMQVLTEKEDTLVGEVKVKVHPAELLGHVATGFKRFKGAHHFDIGHGDLGMLGQVDVLFDDQNTL